MNHKRLPHNRPGDPFAWDRASILDAMNQVISRLYAYEYQEPKADGGADTAA